jgi:hypothetical protein
MSGNQTDDKGFVHDTLKSLPTTAVPAALEARILADFDRVAVRRRSGLLARFGERLWPGAPAWQPASVLALSLIVGLTAGALLPATATTTAASGEQIVIASDTTPDLDLDRDQ